MIVSREPAILYFGTPVALRRQNFVYRSPDIDKARAAATLDAQRAAA